MPIKTRIDMLATGIKTPVGVKLLGEDLEQLAALGFIKAQGTHIQAWKAAMGCLQLPPLPQQASAGGTSDTSTQHIGAKCTL